MCCVSHQSLNTNVTSNKYFELKKKLVGRRWGAANSNYLLVMVSTFVMPFSMDLPSPTMTPGCITQKLHKCIRFLNTNQQAVPKHLHSYIIGKLAIAWESALSVWMRFTG